MRALIVIFTILAGVGAYSGLFYTTGTQFYEGCWERRAQQKGFADPEAKNPRQATLWASCTPIVAEAMDSAGFAIGSSADGAPQDIKALAKVCPDRFTELPLDLRQLYAPVIEMVEKTGGPSIVDQVAPASWLVDRAIKARWPRCAEAARPLIAKAKN
jgi:hypothetical protein